MKRSKRSGRNDEVSRSNIETVLSLINVCTVSAGVVLSLMLTLRGGFSLGALTLVVLIPYTASVTLYWLISRNLTEVLVYALLYPFSVIYNFLRSESDLEDYFNVPLPNEVSPRIEESVLDTLPVKALLAIGSLDEKKRIVRHIETLVKYGVDIEHNMGYLNILLRDPHMDVVLYASQAKENIENHFVSKLSALRRSGSLFEYALTLYNYLRTGIPVGKVREALVDRLTEALKGCPRHPRYYEMMFYVTGDDRYLLESYREFKDRRALERWKFEKLRRRQFEQLRDFSST